MSSSIPDSMSTSDLVELMASAAKNSTIEPDNNTKMTDEQKQMLVAKTIEELTDKFETMFGYKLAAMYCLTALFRHNNAVHERCCEDGEFAMALCWGRDAGQLQLMLKELSDVCCGPEDFFTADDN